jgi:hypothetical protein
LFRSLVLSLALIASLFPANTAQAAEFDPNDIVFPVQGEVYYSDTYDAPRDGGARQHNATDIMTYGVKGVPVVAAADGVVDWMSSSCCALSLDHGNGWETWYIHLDNDTPGTDDGQGWGIADGLVKGTAVEAGQLIGWVGDSGNAEWTAPHLHFEIKKDGVPLNPYPYLLAAQAKTQGQFVDDDHSKHEADIEKIYAAGITIGCNPPDNTEFCPDDWVSRGQMSAFIRRWFDFPSSETDYYTDDDGTTFEDDINALTEAGIAFGCGPETFCSDEPLMREEFAEMFVRAFGYTNPEGTDWHVDDDDSVYEEAINALRAAGVTLGCNPPDNTEFCPYRGVEREEMASFFVRALDL